MAVVSAAVVVAVVVIGCDYIYNNVTRNWYYIA